MQSQADSQEGNAVLASEPHGSYLAFEGPLPEAAGNKDSVHPLQHFGNVRFGQLLAVNQVDVHVNAVSYACVVQRLDDRQVGVWQARVFPDDGDIDLAVALRSGCYVILQWRLVQLAFGQLEPAQHLHVESLLEQVDGHLVDARRIDARQDRVDVDVAEMGDFRADGVVHLVVGPAYDEVGLDAHRAHLLHGVLCGLRFDFVSGSDVGHEAHVHEHDVVYSQLMAQLADCLDERLAFDVADGAADFGDHDVGAGLRCRAQNAILDGVGDVRNDLNGAAQEIAASLAGDKRLVDRALREVRFAREALVDESLVVAEIEIALVAVVGHEDLAMLEWAHCAGVDVEIGVHLLHGHPVAARFEQMPKRSGGDSLAQRRYDAARYEDVLCHVASRPRSMKKAPGGHTRNALQTPLDYKARPAARFSI